MMNNKKIFILIEKLVEMSYDEREIIKFYIQLIKMKKKRPHIDTLKLLHKCYPNYELRLQKIMNNVKIYLNNKSDCFELGYSGYKITFSLQDINCFHIQKKHNFKSLLYFIIYSIGISIVFIFNFALSHNFLLYFLLFSFLFFIVFLYKQIYKIDLILVNEQFSFESKDEDLIQDFLMLHYFYFDYKSSI